MEKSNIKAFSKTDTINNKQGYWADGDEDLYLKEYTEPDMAKIIRLAQMEQYRNPSAYEFMKDFFYMLPINIAEYLFKLSIKMKIIKDTDASLLAYEFESVLLHLVREYILEDFYNGDVEAIKARMKQHVRFFCERALDIIK